MYSAATLLRLWIKILDFLRQLVQIDALRHGVHYGVPAEHLDTLVDSELIESLHGEEKAPADAGEEKANQG